VRNVLRSVVIGSVLVSPAAMAGVTANFGVTSEYLFRGIPQTNGAAVQGGVDLTTDAGLYVGGWASNVNFGGGENGNEFDVYGGFTTTLGPVGLDVGAISYIYSETKEAGGDASSNLDFVEGYVGLSVGPLAGKVYYSPDYNNNSNPSLYGTLSTSFAVSDTISLFAQAGSLDWDKTDSYVDFSAGVTGAKDGLSITLGAYGTNGRGAATAAGNNITGGLSGDSDDVKFVISAKKTLDL
jgi:uncharacterized protein (TIGR02001 family)